MLRIKQTHTYTYYKFNQNHYTDNTPARQPHHRFQNINSKYTSPFFLNFTYCNKETNLQGTPQNYDSITQMYNFCPLNKLLNVDESRPMTIPQEFLQPVEVSTLELIYNTHFNHKLYNLIQSTPYEQSLTLKNVTSLKHLNYFGQFCKLKTSFVC